MDTNAFGSCNMGNDAVRDRALKAAEGRNKQMVIELCDTCSNADDALVILDCISSLHLSSDAGLDTVVIALYELSNRGWPGVDLKIKMLARELINYKHSRFARKTAVSVLRLFLDSDCSSSVWAEYFVLLDALDQPQFHLVSAVLPKWNYLMEHCEIAAEDFSTFSWKWLELLLIKAFEHPNGWIRLWALKRSIDTKLLVHVVPSSYVTTVIFPALNGNDLFWRLSESNELSIFLDNFSRFLSLIPFENDSARSFFYREILDAFSSSWSPCPLFFLSSAFAASSLSWFPCLKSADFLMIRKTMTTVCKIQKIPIRLCTSVNFVDLFNNIFVWSSDFAWFFANIANMFDGDLFTVAVRSKLVRGLEKAREDDKISELSAREVLESYRKRTATIDNPTLYNGYADVAWIIAESAGREVCVNLIDMLCRQTLCELPVSICRESAGCTFLLMKAPSELMENAQSFIKGLHHFSVFGLLERFQPLWKNDANDYPVLERFLMKVMAIWPGEEKLRWIDRVISIFSNQEASLPMRSALLRSIFILLNTRGEGINLVEEKVEQSLLNGLFGSPEAIVWNSEKIERQKHFAVENFKMNHFFLRSLFPLAREKTYEELLIYCMAELSQSLTWPYKDILLKSIAEISRKVSDWEVVLCAIEAAQIVVQEEKKSKYHIPSLKALLNICIQEKVLQYEAVLEQTQTIISKLLDSAVLCPFTAYELVKALTNVIDSMPPCWVPYIVRLCSFGPVPSHDRKLVDKAFEITSSSPNLSSLCDSDVVNEHLLPQRIRLQSIFIACKLCSRDATLAHSFMEEIIQLSESLDRTRSKSFGLSLGHRKKTRIMQLLLLILDYVNEVDLPKVYDHCLSCIKDSSQQYSIKLLVEWIIVRIFLRKKEFYESFVHLEKKLARLRIGSMTSWINIIMHFARANTSQTYIEECFELFLRWSTAQNFGVRCTAIAALHCTWECATSATRAKYHHIKSIIDFTGDPAGNARRLIGWLCEDFYFAHFNAARHFTLQTVLNIFPAKTGLPNEETIPTKFFVDFAGFADDRISILNECDDLDKAPSLVYGSLPKEYNTQVFEGCNRAFGELDNLVGAVQRKIDAVSGNWVRPKGTSAIVVATLINKATNLGGLCRTCEVFGAEKFVVSDKNVLYDQNFMALSMSAEKWITVQQVSRMELMNYLSSQRDDGYAIIAAEQTTDSIPLDKFRFPPKSLILLGDEKEGIPVEFIRYVDFIVEIKQFGRIRSLNVHVTGALFIQKYAEDNY